MQRLFLKTPKLLSATFAAFLIASQAVASSGCEPGAAFCLSPRTIQTGEVKVAKNDLCGVSENSPDFQVDLVEPPFAINTDADAVALVMLLDQRCKK